MRYVRGRLVLRLNAAPPEPLLEELNQQFIDLLDNGQFEQSGPQSEERNEPELIGLPRLAFNFNRRSLGRLRQLIDRLNVA
jgi:hypothetical protein